MSKAGSNNMRFNAVQKICFLDFKPNHPNFQRPQTLLPSFSAQNISPMLGFSLGFLTLRSRTSLNIGEQVNHISKVI